MTCLLLLHLVILRLLLLYLEQPDLHLMCAVAIVDHGRRQDDVAFLLQDVVDFAMLAADVEEETVFLFECQVTYPALQPLHYPGELLSHFLHKMPAAVLLQGVEAVQLLFTDLTLQAEVTLGDQRVLLPRLDCRRTVLTRRGTGETRCQCWCWWTGTWWRGRGRGCLDIHHGSDVEGSLVSHSAATSGALFGVPGLLWGWGELLESLQLEDVVYFVMINSDMKKQPAIVGVRLFADEANILLRILVSIKPLP